MNWFSIAQVEEKVRRLPEALASALSATCPQREFSLGRDVSVLEPRQLPPKIGLASNAGQARLLHDLANIELQAMELAVRTLVEFPESPAEFKKELAEIAIGEGRHLSLCLKSMRDLGFEWGHCGVQLNLWQAVGPQDSLLDRILIVHRYLEGSGLDAGESILKRLNGIKAGGTHETVSLIVREEVDHVRFGSLWYRRIAEKNKIDPEEDFRSRIAKLSLLIPRRERLARDLRLKAGFTEAELEVLEQERQV